MGRSASAALLRLYGTAFGRRLREEAAVLLVLAPLMGGTALLLLARVASDLAPRMDGWEPLLWGLGGAAALLACRRAREVGGTGLVAVQPISPFILWLDRTLRAAVRALPVGLALAVCVMALGGGTARWLGVVAVLWVAPLVAVLIPVPTGSLGIRLPALLAAAGSYLLPERLRALARRDLLILGRGPEPAEGVRLAIGAVALFASLERALTAGPDGVRVGLLLVGVCGWAWASALSPLLSRQLAAHWVELDAGVTARRIWRGKLALSGLLGAAAGAGGALVWGWSVPQAVIPALFLGLAAGLSSGAGLMEGDGRPLLSGVVSLILALLVTTLGQVSLGLLLVVPALIVYLEKLGVPRLERRLGEMARTL
ncbi:MAG: hypothetical protein ACE5FN_06020 [Leptospirillia bacterium]